jgi:hypothetical protein
MRWNTYIFLIDIYVCAGRVWNTYRIHITPEELGYRGLITVNLISKKQQKTRHYGSMQELDIKLELTYAFF